MTDVFKAVLANMLAWLMVLISDVQGIIEWLDLGIKAGAFITSVFTALWAINRWKTGRK